MVSDYELYTEEQDITYRKEVAKVNYLIHWDGFR